MRVTWAKEAEVAGDDSQAELAAAEAAFQDRRRLEFMAAGDGLSSVLADTNRVLTISELSLLFLGNY